MFTLGNRVSNPWRKGAIFFTTKILASSPCPKIIGLESKITGKGSISIRRRISSQVNLAKLRYEFSMKFLQTFLFRSLNVEGYRAFLSRNFSCGTCISPRSCAFFFLGRNWIVVTDSDQKSKNFISDTHTFRHLSRAIIEKSCLATDERERTKISIEEDFYARNLDKGRFDREWEIKCWNGNYGGEIARWTRFFLVLSSKIPLNAIRWKVFGPRFEWSRFLKCKCTWGCLTKEFKSRALCRKMNENYTSLRNANPRNIIFHY